MIENKKDRVVVVSGGSRGIGKACVEAFQAEGYKVAALATTKASAAQSGAELSLQANVTNTDEVSAAVSSVRSTLGPISIVINNAGVAGANGNGSAADDAQWHRIFDVNVHGTYNLCNAVLDELPNGDGRIINMGSVLSARGVPDQTAYCAAKHAVLGYTRALAHALAPRRITVNCLCPGWVATDMATQRANEMNVDVESLATFAPLGTTLAPSEVAAAALWLASSSAKNVTGQAIFLDGGVTA